MHRVSSVGAYYITRSKSIIFFVVGKKKLCFDQFRHLLTLRINTRNAIYLINLLLCVLLVVNWISGFRGIDFLKQCFADYIFN